MHKESMGKGAYVFAVHCIIIIIIRHVTCCSQ